MFDSCGEALCTSLTKGYDPHWSKLVAIIVSFLISVRVHFVGRSHRRLHHV